MAKQRARRVADERAADEGRQKSPGKIPTDIEETRGELGDTVEALAAKTDVKAQAKERIASLKGTAQTKKDEFAARARETAPDSAGAGAQQITATVKTGRSRSPRLVRSRVGCSWAGCSGGGRSSPAVARGPRAISAEQFTPGLGSEPLGLPTRLIPTRYLLSEMVGRTSAPARDRLGRGRPLIWSRPGSGPHVRLAARAKETNPKSQVRRSDPSRDTNVTRSKPGGQGR